MSDDKKPAAAMVPWAVPDGVDPPREPPNAPPPTYPGRAEAPWQTGIPPAAEPPTGPAPAPALAPTPAPTSTKASAPETIDPQSLVGSVFGACARILEVLPEIEKKVRIGRDKLVADLKVVHAVLYRIAESLKVNPAMAPGGDCKDLASEGHLLHRVVKIGVKEEEQEAWKSRLVGALSARRIMFEIEDAKDRALIVDGFVLAVSQLQTVMDRLSPPKPDKGKAPGRRF